MKVAFDARPAMDAYSRAFRHMTTLPGFDPKAVLRAEAGSILKKWAGVTKVGNRKDADERARYRAGKRAFRYTSIDKNPYGITVNTGASGGHPGEVWYRHLKSKRFQQAGVVNDQGSFTPSWIHWKAPIWDRIISGAQLYGQQLTLQLEVGRESIGFARQSVIQIADSLGIDLNRVQGQGISAAGIAKARAAIASSGKSYINGFGTEGGNIIACYVKLLSTLPFSQKIQMDRQLAEVVAGRAKYIEKSYEKDAFDSVKGAARAFPNILKAA